MNLPYALDDDRAAITAVGHEINRPNPARWRAMTTDDERLRQTHRALGLLIKQVEVSFLQRKASLRAVEGTYKDRRRAKVEYEEWKSRTIHFLNRACERRGSIAPRVRLLDETNVIDDLRTALETLARAVTDHRDAIRAGTRNETTADRMLWLQLDLSRHTVLRARAR
ncbi:Hypothetical protein AJAP_07245 [Amycolatopsis japonica]|uniref:Uncharacterized protein n=1 Tax=Amycolatopsis japonica TaxID=208439 RepID=A0A075UJT4_9PSEU|nr:hypothetical protein [Amycolatopsis japonica]AIG74362.1 Hypothetical protein AJAP_07245 [Amycolatopsis japonica]